MSSFDLVADRFERYRALPGHVPLAIRGALHAHGEIDAGDPLLEVGCGTGRIGAPFIDAGDNYFGLDLSMEMLHEFEKKNLARRPNVVHGDGCLLPFRDRAFTAVLMTNLLGAGNWRPLLLEAQRALQRSGVLAIGKTERPADGIDAAMRGRLRELIASMGLAEPSLDHGVVTEWLRARSSHCKQITAAHWTIDRTPRQFFLRKLTAARFGSLPTDVRENALRSLADWTEQTIGPLDSPVSETHHFHLELYWF